METPKEHFELENIQMSDPNTALHCENKIYISNGIQRDTQLRSVYFGPLAWGCAFYVGVHYALQKKHGLNFYNELSSISGDSVGSLFALGLALGKSAEHMDSLYRNLSERGYKEGLSANTNIVDEAIDSLLSDPNDYKRLSGKFSVGVTTFPLQHHRIWTWQSNEQLRQTMHASMYLPLYCSRIPSLLVNGMRRSVIDGGFSLQGHDFPDQDLSLYIGIDNCAEITMDMKVNVMLFPQTGEGYEALVQAGMGSYTSWDSSGGNMHKKVGVRKKNWLGYLCWLFKCIAFLCYLGESALCCIPLTGDSCIRNSQAEAHHQTVVIDPNFDESQNAAEDNVV